jgi:asparagine synthase (glutamine-hydrolysing)
MCGVIARFGDKNALESGLLLHRGPDAQSIYGNEEAYVNYFQLAITGVANGRTPIISKDGSIRVYLNGEIYNHKKLNYKHGLKSGCSDMQVVAEGVSKYGIEFTSELRGMFAGIIINTSLNRYYIVRDALGEKPLFMSKVADQLYVSSEFVCMLKAMNRPLKLRRESVESFLRLNYVEEPNTFDTEILHVPKGSVLEVNLSSGTLTRILTLPGFSEEEISRPLDQLIDEILCETLSTEVPTGLALSGGIDSNALMIAASKYDANDLTAFTITDGLDITESIDALSNAGKLEIPCEVLTYNSAATIEEFCELVIAMDQPIADPSALSYFRIFREAQKQGKKIVLLGHGPDEFFWGYPWYFSLLSAAKLKNRIPEIIYTPASSKRLLKILNVKRVDSLQLNSEDPFLTSPIPSKSFRARIVHGYLTHNGFAQLDRLAMHFSLEPRVPFADSRIYGWAQSNSKEAANKVEFKEALDVRLLPGLLVRTKTGFKANIKLWFDGNLMENSLLEAYNKVFAIRKLWRFKIPKFLLSPSDKYKILILGTWLKLLEEES